MNSDRLFAAGVCFKKNDFQLVSRQNADWDYKQHKRPVQQLKVSFSFHLSACPLWLNRHSLTLEEIALSLKTFYRNGDMK
jgi:hypothetical protein